jgi:hypothetical protein
MYTCVGYKFCKYSLVEIKKLGSPKRIRVAAVRGSRLDNVYWIYLAQKKDQWVTIENRKYNVVSPPPSIQIHQKLKCTLPVKLASLTKMCQ